MKVPFLDLSRQYRYIKNNIFMGFEGIFEKQNFILGKELNDFEVKMTEYLDVPYAIGVASGSDALWLSFEILGIGPGDEVITTPFTHASTAIAIYRTGATPIFVDIDERTFNINPGAIEKKINSNTKAIMPVHLYGQAADMNFIMKIAKQHDLFIIEDACQAFGTEYGSEKVGTLGILGAFSFYPTKSLGAYGDAGMIVTKNEKYYNEMLKMRNHGELNNNYSESIGVNSRLDTLQAVVLMEKLKYIDNWNGLRMEHAKLYNELFHKKGLDEYIEIPYESEMSTHIYNLYTIKVKEKRDLLYNFLYKKEIGTKIYYKTPLHLQKGFNSLNYKEGDFPIAEKIGNEVLSLPIFPELREDEIELVVKTIEDFYKEVKE
ncbi:DegT/DnrJ/EryC1/StrS family aminotransferase [bacterium]|nr:DegT/DnrJ/EryC1/StrS family aminotransferase [bacterium]